MAKFEIDFFELSFLAEACIPHTPIARAMFWKRLINSIYKDLTIQQRKDLFTWMNNNSKFQYSLDNGNEDCLLFNARFNPDNQYVVETKSGDTIRAFLLDGKYHTKINTFVSPDMIKEVTKQPM